MHYATPPIVGGVESVLGHHARLMADAGHEVTLVAGRGAAVDERIPFVHLPLADSRHPDVLAVKGQLDAGRVPPQFHHLVQVLLDGLQQHLSDTDVIIAHNVCSLHKNLALTAALRRFCAGAGAPRLIAWHHDLAWSAPHYQAELHDGWPWDLIRQDWPDARPRHVVVSELRRQELAALFGLPPERIAVVPSGLDVPTFFKLGPPTAALLSQLNLLSADPLLLLPVRLTRRKNIELALRVLAHLRPSFPSASLIVTGPPGPHNPTNQAYFDQLRALRHELGLEPAAHFLAEIVGGYLPDPVIADLYRLADTLFMPSREEGFGIPILEAGLAGIPIFCADIPSLRELAGGHATYFSPDGDPAAIARQIVARLESDPVFQLRRCVRREYTWGPVYTHRIAPLLEEP